MDEFKGDWVWIRQILKMSADSVRSDQPSDIAPPGLVDPERLDAFIKHFDGVFGYNFGS